MKEISAMKIAKYFLRERLVMILSLIVIITPVVFSQSISNSKDGDVAENVEYKVANGKVIITYDLPGSTDQLYDVSLILKRTSNVEDAYEPKSVSGDIGEERYGGKNKQIIWEIKKDFPEGLTGEDFYFIIRAEKINEGSNILMWAGFGLAAVAAVVTYVVVGEESESASTQNPGSSFPLPPGRP
jgi:hypothetical protein